MVQCSLSHRKHIRHYAFLGGACPDDISFDPKLSGWYKIYVCVPTFSHTEVLLKLTQDDAFYRIIPLHTDGLTFTRLEESFWRYAKLDGQSIIMSKKTLNPEQIQAICQRPLC